ncbi:hypothetical protein D3C78_1683570 [compost metagenome]
MPIFTRLTRTPDSSAVRSLPPMANTWRPKTVLRLMYTATRVNRIISQIDTGTDNSRAVPSSRKPLLFSSA